jgi:hypothetical protein
MLHHFVQFAHLSSLVPSNKKELAKTCHPSQPQYYDGLDVRSDADRPTPYSRTLFRFCFIDTRILCACGVLLVVKMIIHHFI